MHSDLPTEFHFLINSSFDIILSNKPLIKFPSNLQSSKTQMFFTGYKYNEHCVKYILLIREIMTLNLIENWYHCLG